MSNRLIKLISSKNKKIKAYLKVETIVNPILFNVESTLLTR